MMSSFLGLVSLLTSTFVIPFAGAAEPINLSLPQEVNYVEQITSQVGQATFATDPATTTALVAAAHNENKPAQLEAFIVNFHPCVRVHDVLAYRIFIRNIGDQTARDVVAQFQYPDGVEFRLAIPAPTNIDLDQNILEWQLGDIAPGHANGVELHITLVVIEARGPASTHLSLKYASENGQQGQTLTSHTVRNNCPNTPPFESKPLPDKEPAIICDPAELGCQNNLPELGFNFGQVTQNAAKVPTVCSPNDPRPCNPNNPQLGVRFLEAISSIVPGECSVLSDNIISTPQYHDALNRRADPAAFYLLPLYEVGQDFITLMHKNELFGIQNIIAAKKSLREIHNNNWNQYEKIVIDAVNERITLDDSLEQFDESLETWLESVEIAQEKLKKQYEAMQEDQRQDNFWPIICEQQEYQANECKAVIQARTSIQRACKEEGDGGLAELLPDVKELYDEALNNRATAYPNTQTQALNQYQQEYDQQRILLETAIQEVKALQAEEEREDINLNDMEPLREHERQIVRVKTNVLAQLTDPYSDHQYEDKQTDFRIRLNVAERALDPAKTVATTCQKDIDFGPQVSTTWCESGNYPAYILQEARQPDKKDIAPPELIGGQTQIDISQVIGAVCGGRPGDPYWSPSCSCRCNEFIPCGPLRIPTLCQLCPPGVTRHDILVTSQLECFWENADDHLDAAG